MQIALYCIPCDDESSTLSLQEALASWQSIILSTFDFTMESPT
ncbi:hypothetical protein [Helicobacter rodentium]|nr:hypothetical protein [Helicobacter rodentium]